jgi:hypothetical protein
VNSNWRWANVGFGGAESGILEVHLWDFIAGGSHGVCG